MHRLIECGVYVGWGRKKISRSASENTHACSCVCVCVSEKDER